MQALEPAKGKRKKIAVIVPKYGTVGGGEKFASEVTARLACNEEYEIHVFANRWVANSDRITFHKIPKWHFPRTLRPLFFAWYVGRCIDRIGFDLVHTHHWIFRADIYQLHGTPHKVWIRDVQKSRFSLFNTALGAVEKRAMEGGARSWFLPVSSIAMETYKKEYATLPGQWEIVHPGVEVSRFAAPDRASCRNEIRAKYGFTESDVLLLFVGMNFEVKGLDTIITSLAQALQADPQSRLRLLVVGRGDEAKYRRQAQSLGIADAVIFAGTQTAGLERYYRAADAFVLLSRFDTFGMVVLEAMAAGLPAIVSPNVGGRDLVEQGKNGFVLPAPEDADAAAGFMQQIADPALRARMGEAAAVTAAEHDWEKLAQKMDGIYRQVFASKEER